jgi:hypothetical protein
MKYILATVIVLALTGCTTSQPNPPYWDQFDDNPSDLLFIKDKYAVEETKLPDDWDNHNIG